MTDVRLGRIPQVDERNRDYPVRGLLVGAQLETPRSYTWSVPLHLDQGQVPSCVGHGFAHDRAGRPRAVAGVTELEALSLYESAQRIDGDPTPHEGTSVLAGAKTAQVFGWATSYAWAFTLKDALLAVSHHGPVVIGVDWWTGMMDTDSAGRIHRTGQVEGGHCVLVKGVSVTRKTVRVHNSWGTSWGNGGDADLSWDDLATLLAAGGDCATIVKPSPTHTP